MMIVMIQMMIVEAKNIQALILKIGLLLILVIPVFCFNSCLSDTKYYEENSIGIYSINLKKSKIEDSLSLNALVLELKPNNKYVFSQKLPFIDQSGTWKVEGKGVVKYISLITKEGKKDRISVCCDDDNEITFHCYLDKSNQFERIIFLKK